MTLLYDKRWFENLIGGHQSGKTELGHRQKKAWFWICEQLTERYYRGDN